MGNAIAKHILDGNDILKWFYLGAEEVSSNRKYLNSINVFPVPDGDKRFLQVSRSNVHDDTYHYLGPSSLLSYFKKETR